MSLSSCDEKDSFHKSSHKIFIITHMYIYALTHTRAHMQYKFNQCVQLFLGNSE